MNSRPLSLATLAAAASRPSTHHCLTHAEACEDIEPS